jgi:hypothetical protein
MGNSAHARVLGAGTVTLEFTSGKTIQLKNVQHVPTEDHVWFEDRWMVASLCDE